MKTIKVSEATSIQLDWLVAKCENLACHINTANREDVHIKIDIFATDQSIRYNPTTNWSQGGPLLEREKITVSDANDAWAAGYNGTLSVFGPTILIAAMRCYVMSKCGDTVEVPDEL